MRFIKKLPFLRLKDKKELSPDTSEERNEKLLKGINANRQYFLESYFRNKKTSRLQKLTEFMTLYGYRILALSIFLLFSWMYLTSPVIVASQAGLQAELIRSVTLISISCVLAACYSPEIMSRYLDKLLPMLAFLIGYFFPSGLK